MSETDPKTLTPRGVAGTRRPGRIKKVEDALSHARAALDRSKELGAAVPPEPQQVQPRKYFDAASTRAEIAEIRAEIRADFERARKGLGRA